MILNTQRLKILHMKKQFITLLAMSLSGFMYSQVGINTPNPQGSFHIDGAKDNPETGIPSAAQQANDIILTPAGNIGIGTTTPINSFHVVGSNAAQGSYTLIDAPGGNGISGTAMLRLRNTSVLADGNTSLIGFSNNGPTSGGPSWQLGSIRTRPTTSGGDDFMISVSTGAAQQDRLRIVATTGNVGIGTITPNSKLQITGGDVYIENVGSGIIMKSPNGTCRRVTITDAGAMNVSAVITCP